MNKFIYSLLLLAFCFTASAQSSDSLKRLAEYNNYLVGEQQKVMNQVVTHIVQSAYNNDIKKVEEDRIKLLKQIEGAITRVKALEGYTEDSVLKEEALAVLALYKEAYTEGFNEISILKQKKEESYTAMKNYFAAEDKNEEKVNIAVTKFRTAQNTFLKKYGLSDKLKEEAKDSTMATVSDINKYFRDVYLEYFRAFKLNTPCLDALNLQDVELLEKARKALLKGASESYVNIMVVSPYANDADFKNKGLEYVSYCKALAQKDLAEIVAILKNEDRTNDDIDRYNAIIDQYNIEHQKLIDSFYEAKTRLMKTHIPNASGEKTTDGSKG